MTERRYDDFRLTLTARADGGYDVVATPADGPPIAGEFVLPVAPGELEQTVVRLAHDVPRRGDRLGATRGVRPVEPATMDAEALGGALNGALLAGAIGAGYDAARLRAGEEGRGLRLTLSLAGAPALLGVPWELLYRRPRFLANQRRTPLVRHLDVGSFPPPPPIDGAVRVLGIVASPADCAPLDVAAERARVERAVSAVVAAGRVELDWLEPATPRRLREALRDGTYHVIHYVGHSDFTAAGEGELFLEDDEGRRAEVDGTELANLLADQDRLRLVVLNSCEGARTSLTDPFAGVATTLVQLGVPAVVAMQFEISDDAAILFAEELYTNLIARQAPVDAAVSEARKAIYIEQAGVEWATPVLFMGDTDVDLFDFRRAAAGAPAAVTTEDREQPGRRGLLPPPPPPSTTPPATTPPSRRRRLLVPAIAAVLLAAGGIAVINVFGGEDGDDGDDAGPTVSTVPADVAADPAASAVPAPTTVVATTSPAASASGGGETEHVAGEITVVGDVVRSPFQAAAGDIIHLGGSEPCGSQLYWVEQPSGSRLGTTSTCYDVGRQELAETGEYTVVVDSNGGVGRYDITLTRVPPDVVAPIPGDGQLVREFDVVGAQHRWTFTATAGEIVHVAGSQPCGAQLYWLEEPSGSRVGTTSTCYDIGRQMLAQSGEYTVVVDSNGAVGRYALAFDRVLTDVTQPLPPDGRAVSEIAGVGAQHRWTFEAAAGESISVTGSQPCGDQLYWIERPSGSRFGTTSTCYGLAPQAQAESGPYTLVVDSNGATGAYALTVVTG